MNLVKILILVLITLFTLSCSAPQIVLEHSLTCKEDYFSLEASSCMDEQKVLTYLENYKVIFIGDHHGENALHVKIQSLLNALHVKGYNLHIANEWFTTEDANHLKRYKSHDINESQFLEDVNWSKNIGYSFDSYSKTYEVNSSLYGINLSRKFRKKISNAQTNIMTPSQLEFFKNLDLNNSMHSTLVEPYMSHCSMYKSDVQQESCKERMYRVQVAWDSYMALESYKLSSSVLKTDKDILVVFVGAMHLAYGAGINMRFSRLSVQPSVTLLPYDENVREVEVGYSDFLLLYRPKDENR